MSRTTGRLATATIAFGVALAGLAGIEPASAADTAAIKALRGNWGGSGRIYYTDGTTESLRCTASYTGGGSELNMTIRCRSDSRDINVKSSLRILGGKAEGDWQESTFNAAGEASGSAGSSSMQLSLSGGGFSGSMSVSFGGSSHSVTINSQGIAMSKATISFSRR